MKRSFLLLWWILSSLLFLVGCDSPNNVHTWDLVSISYVASFLDGTPFEQSWANFVVGSGNVMEGLEAGVLGMKVWQTKNITILPEQWYGKQYSNMKVQKMPKATFDVLQTPLSGKMVQLWSIQWAVKWEEKDPEWNTIVLIDSNPRETWDKLVYKITLIEKK